MSEENKKEETNKEETKPEDKTPLEKHIQKEIDKKSFCSVSTLTKTDTLKAPFPIELTYDHLYRSYMIQVKLFRSIMQLTLLMLSMMMILLS